MSASNPPRGRSNWPLILLAILLGSCILVGANAATALALGEELRFGFRSDAPDVAVMHIVIATAPMFVLALRGVRSVLMWAVAFILTAAFWAFSVWSIWRASLHNFEGGADIGMGLIMLASPFVTLGCLVVLRELSKLRRGQREREPR